MPERTEAPTGRRLQEAREQGQVPYSREINAAVGLLVSAVLLGNQGRLLLINLGIAMKDILIRLPDAQASGEWLSELAVESLQLLLPQLAVIILTLLVVGVSVTFAQTRFLFASKRLGFDLKKLNPISGLKRMFSLTGLVELFKGLLKLVIVGFIVYRFLESNQTSLLNLIQMDMRSALNQWGELVLALFFRVGGAYLLLAGADYAYQLWDNKRSLKMSKEDVKEDRKRSEGDPLIKSRIRSKQMAFARQRMFANIPKADVVIVNPTHLAIALGYEAEKMQAPVVLAKGAYKVAERIRELATERDIPVIQNVPLARGLYASVEVDQQIPPEFFMAIAEILAQVYKLKARRPGQKTSIQTAAYQSQMGA
jgi:flagellar biosynthesis protein FlhB